MSLDAHNSQLRRLIERLQLEVMLLQNNAKVFATQAMVYAAMKNEKAAQEAYRHFYESMNPWSSEDREKSIQRAQKLVADVQKGKIKTELVFTKEEIEKEMKRRRWGPLNKKKNDVKESE